MSDSSHHLTDRGKAFGLTCPLLSSLHFTDAAEAVDVDYSLLPWVTDSVTAAADDAPCVWDEVPDNVCCDTTFGDPAATAKRRQEERERVSV